MEDLYKNQVFSKEDSNSNTFFGSLEDEINTLKSILSKGLNMPEEEIKISFPSLKNFYFVNNVYKSSWAIYIHNEKLPKLLFTGNFLIQGGHFGKRSSKSIFGAKALSNLTSIANTYSLQASTFKQNWTLDLNLFEENDSKLKLTRKEYQEFLTILNKVRAQWLLHLCEEGNFDFVISEFSEPSDQMFFIDIESVDSLATKIKTFFKPITESSINLLKKLSQGTEFEGKFLNLQPGNWLRDDILIEMEKYNSNKFFDTEPVSDYKSEYEMNSPFKAKMQALKPIF